MTPHEHQILVQKIAGADHEIISRAFENFKRFFKGDRPPDAAQQFEDTRRIMAEKISAHFAMEENLLFPGLLADNPSEKAVQVIAQLRREHPLFLEDLQRLNLLLRGRSLTNLSSELWMETIRFLDRFEQHAAKEEKLFELFPE